MSGGSTEKEAEDDRQCIHCGLWYSKAGVLNHEENCDLAEFEVRKLSLEDPFAIVRAPDVTAKTKDGKAL